MDKKKALEYWKPFDTAEYKRFTKQTDKLHKLSIVYPYYVNVEKYADGILDNFKYYEAMPYNLLEKIHFIVVDDCSPVFIDFDNVNLNLTLIKIDKDIRWNSGGAKNLGVFCCETSRIIIADSDIIFPVDTLEACMREESIPDDEVFVFDRFSLDKNMQWYKDGVHPNCFFMTKQSYLDLHGYNEDFCGYYGDDLYFNQLLHIKRKIFNCGENILNNNSSMANNQVRHVDNEVWEMLEANGIMQSLTSLRFPWHFVKRYMLHK